MKKFEFPLDRVAKWSHQQLALEQVSLRRMLEELLALDQQMRKLWQQATDNQSRLQSQAVVAGCELATLARFIRKLMEERVHLQQVRAGLAARVEAQRQRVVAGHRKVKLLENLHSRRREEWVLAVSQEEEALASDLFLAKLARDLRHEDTAIKA